MKSSSKETRRRLWAWGLAIALPASVGTVVVGCQGNVPPASVMPSSSCPTPILFEGFESLTPYPSTNPVTNSGGATISESVTYFVTDKGVTLNAPVPFTPFTSILSPSVFYATQGSHSLDLDITTACCPAGVPVTLTGFNQNIFNLNPSSPFNWSNVSALTMDLTVDPGLVAGATYHMLLIVANTSAVRGSNPYGTYFQSISNDTPSINAGSQSVTFHINFAAGLIQPGDPLTQLQFIYNNNAGSGAGNIYVDNMQLLQKCP